MKTPTVSASLFDMNCKAYGVTGLVIIEPFATLRTTIWWYWYWRWVTADKSIYKLVFLAAKVNKHQKRPVQVINLVSQDTIEQRMLSLLEQKRSLAEGVVDGKDIKEMSLPSGRAAFLERIDSLMSVETLEPKTVPADPFDHLRDGILARWGNQLELHGEGNQQTLLVVAERINDALQSALARQLHDLFPEQTPQLKLLDRNTFATIHELIEAGVLSANQETGRTLYRASAEDDLKDDEQLKRLNQAHNHLAQSEHKRRMTKVLKEGDFATEALVPLREAVEIALQALAIWQGHDSETEMDPEWINSALVQADLLPSESLSVITALRDDKSSLDQSRTSQLLTQGDNLLSKAASILE